MFHESGNELLGSRAPRSAVQFGQASLDLDTLTAALRHTLDHLRRQVGAARIRETARNALSGPEPALALERAARDLAMAVRSVALSPRAVVERARAGEVIWLARAGSVYVVSGRARGGARAVLLNGDRERRVRLEAKSLAKIFGTREHLPCVVIEPQLPLEWLSEREAGGKSPWARLIALLRLQRRDLGAVLVYAVVLGGLSLAVPIAVQVTVNTIALGALLQPLTVLVTALFVCLALAGTLTVIRDYVIEILQRRVFVRVASDFVQRFGLLAGEVRSRHHAPELANRFFEVVTIQKTLPTLLIDGLGLALQTLLAIVLLAFYHPFLLAFGLCLAVALGVVLALGRGAVASARQESDAKYGVAAWIETVAERRMPEDQDPAQLGPERGDDLCRDYLGARRRHFASILRHWIAAATVSTLAMVSLLGLGGYLVTQNQLTLGQLVAAELVLGAWAASFVKVGKQLESFYDLLAALDKIGKILDLPLEPGASSVPTRSPTVTLTAAAGNLDAARLLSRLLVAVLIGAMLALALVPWQQSVRGRGRVIAYAPLERQQEVEAPIAGRVVRWYVHEGGRVSEGDPIVELSDNDPEIISRLERERTASHVQVTAAKASVESALARIAALQSARSAAISNAKLRVQMAEERCQAAAKAVDAAVAALDAATINAARVARLESQGLSSAREHELADLAHKTASADLDRARATLRAAEGEKRAGEQEVQRVASDNDAQIEAARASLESYRGGVGEAEQSLAQLEVKLSRQQQMLVRAPRDGVILRLIAREGTEMVAPGDPLVMLVPDTSAKAVELWVSGNDAPLVREGDAARLAFEGWPALQFTGWPSAAVGTFPGKVAFVDAMDDGQGRFRVVIVPPAGAEWPTDQVLRQGVRAEGWMLLNRVKAGFELWRQFNGFPPSRQAPEEFKK